ncbi:protein translocase subunit SecD [Streptomyces sp. Je 1-4]|uniref:protein translocase subunit SecD n=1 Tax=Streptomyces TaxID=1883 RepID=UPI00140F2899|nr:MULTISPECIES: protein translocase subunit SecD [unclassified Streptomyces]QIK09794.1 protein translocase subunit SecD [Streptomyces sp. ID38640]UYB43508.1 protein translocase subunit SecD [Streptomyces sp. Je 1-4]UZQ39891.1 protein translocase subunit SecD [Streptomyces sp. Je 1-4] [Streptomyces sp. Je 1-4 4N24]UZQ47308.1 protein translocase subunit SecD [Streptomyces sp. Je 1-4] [Streptomyces sp. Je 1-4 4N24_ara]
MAAPKKGRRAPASQGHPGRTLILVLIAMAGLIGGMFYSGTMTPRLGIDLAGGTSFTLAAQNQPGKPNAINETNMNTAAGIMERRVNGLGVSEAEVQTQGSDHIIVNIPKGTDAKQAREQVGTTAKLGFRPVITTTMGTKTPEPKPNPSKSGANGKGDKAAGDQAKDRPGTEQKASSSQSPSAKPTTQGRAVTAALKKAPSDKPTPSGSVKPSTPPAPPVPPAGAEIPPALQKQLNALDCSTKQSRATAADKAANAKPSDPVVACKDDGAQKYVLGPVGVEGTDVKDAKAVFDSQSGQGWIVQMDLTGEGGKKFADVTGKLAAKQRPQNQFAIALDGQVVSDPSVDRAITGGSATISGGFTQQSAEDLGNMLSYGSLPLSFKIDDETTVTAALGGEQLQAGLIAGAIGLALVIVYLVAYYRGLALVALASLFVSAILTYTIMTLLGPTIGFALNLPAVCGAIVAIGITADSFIVYFERIRDEIRDGRTLRPAVERGWPRARRTIMVSDFVSFLAAAVLFIVTVGKVKGFAFTLGLTTVLDVVVVFFFTKPLMTMLARRKFFSDGHPWSGLDPKRLGAKPPLRRRRGAAPTQTKEA